MKRVKLNKILFILLASFMGLMISLAQAGDEQTHSPTGDQSIQKTEPGQGMSESGQITCSGTLVKERNWLGMTKGYLLQQDDGKKLMVSNQDADQLLSGMAGKRVEITGTLEESKGNSRMIREIEIKESKSNTQ